MLHSPTVPLFVFGRPQLQILRHPTFGCFLDWYRAVSSRGLQVNPLAMDLATTIHKLAKDRQDRVFYCDTIEALYTAMCHTHRPPVRDDWRVWSTLDALGVTDSLLREYVQRALQAYYMGGIIPCMVTPEMFDAFTPTGFHAEFISPTPTSTAAYSLEERAASLYGRFDGSVVSAWRGPGADALSRYAYEYIPQEAPQVISSSPVHGFPGGTLAVCAPPATVVLPKPAVLWMVGDKFVECDDNTMTLFGCSNRDALVSAHPWNWSPAYQEGGLDSKQRALEFIRNAEAGVPQVFPWRHIQVGGFPIDVEVGLERVLHHGCSILRVTLDPKVA